MPTKTFRVKATMLVLRDPKTNRKNRHMQGTEVELTEEQAERFMQEGPDVVRGMAVEPVDDDKNDDDDDDNKSDNKNVTSNREESHNKAPLPTKK